ncbi:MAG: hypothetical protein JO352_16175 [Chloroflexi bacterium]|nr:hypothetical protein [Chloroflexota bacterium]MBV9600989.1 hypothetical protein [Chloroflexota bacterium]
MPHVQPPVARSHEVIVGPQGFKLHFRADDVRVRDVDARFHGAEYFFNWCQEFEGELVHELEQTGRFLRPAELGAVLPGAR